MGFPWDLVVSATTFDSLRTISTQDFTVKLAEHPICPTDEARKIYGDEAMVWEQGWRIFTINTHQAFLRNHMIGACYRELAISYDTHGSLAISVFHHELAVSSCHILRGGLIDSLQNYPRHTQEAFFLAGLFLCSHMRDAKGNLCDAREFGSRGPEKSLRYIKDVWCEVKLPSPHPLSIIPLQDLMVQAACLLRSLLDHLIEIPVNHSDVTPSKVFTPRVNLQVLAVTFGIVSFRPEHLEIPEDPAALQQALLTSPLYLQTTELYAPVDGADFKNWSRRLQGAMPIAYPDITLVWGLELLRKTMIANKRQGFSTEELDNIGWAVLRSITSFL